MFFIVEETGCSLFILLPLFLVVRCRSREQGPDSRNGTDARLTGTRSHLAACRLSRRTKETGEKKDPHQNEDHPSDGGEESGRATNAAQQRTDTIHQKPDQQKWHSQTKRKSQHRGRTLHHAPCASCSKDQDRSQDRASTGGPRSPKGQTHES